MDPITKQLLTIAAALLVGGGVVWAVMTIGQLRHQMNALAGQVSALSDKRRQAEKDHAAQLLERDQALSQAKAENDELRRTAWPGNLTLDQRAWASNLTTMQELVAHDSLDVLQRLNPDAARRVLDKFIPQLVRKDGIK